MEIDEQEMEELLDRPYQRRAFPRSDHSVVTVWTDRNRAVHLTITENEVTIPLVETNEEGAGL